MVTGRHFADAAPVIKRLMLSGPCILNGGAQVIDFPSEKVVWEQGLSEETLKAISELTSGYPLLISDGLTEGPYSNHSLPKILSAAITQITQTDVEEITTKLSHLPEIVLHTVPSWNKGKIDLLINHVSATKLHGIYAVAKILGIETHEIIGVGDGGNDLPLLMACGLKVAMGNANENLKAIADYVAPTVDEDGVADVIEKFILNSK